MPKPLVTDELWAVVEPRAAVWLGAPVVPGMALWGVLGLLAPGAGAAFERVQPRLQVLEEGGIGALVDVIQ